MTKKVLVLRTAAADMTSRGGFKYPKRGWVKAPDWSAAPVCGGGLHGLLWGEGDGSHLNWDDDAKWLVLEVKEQELVDLDKKVKFPGGRVVFCGDRKGATQYLLAHGGAGKAICGAALSQGDKAAVSAGYRGQASAGSWGQASAGEGGQASAGEGGQASAGSWGQASAGSWGQASAGYRGQASAGSWGQASAGEGGQASAGENGTIIVQWWDNASKRYRVKVGYIGEDGLKPDTWYKVGDDRSWVEVGPVVKKDADKKEIAAA